MILVMTTLLKKLKSFFEYGASNSSSSTLDKMSGSGKSAFRLVSPFLNLNKNPEDKWIIVESIGDGAFGKIYKTQHKESKRFAALKQVAVEDEDNISEFCSEVKVLCKVKHRNILELFEAYYYASKIWMFLEYCQIGSVDAVMQELEKPLDEFQISCILNQLCQALSYLHNDLHIIHRDIKAANVLLTSDACVKLADFGVSAICDNGTKRNSFIGSPYWMAPEVIYCETNKDESYDFMADIWSLGIMTMEMAQMNPPWHEINPSRVTLKILRNSPPSLDDPNKWSQAFKDFLSCCLKKDPKERVQASKLLKQEFLTSGSNPSPLRELIAEVTAEVRVETKEIEEGDVDLHTGPHTMCSNEMDELEKNYLPNVIASTNIDEELAKQNSSKPQHLSEEPPVMISANAVTSATSPNAEGEYVMSHIPSHHTKQGSDRLEAADYKQSWKSTVEGANKPSVEGKMSDEVMKGQGQGKTWSELQLSSSKLSKGIIANDNFSFGQLPLGLQSSKFPASFPSVGRGSRFIQMKTKKCSGGFKEGLKVGLFGALASRQRLIGRSEEEGKAVDLYRGTHSEVKRQIVRDLYDNDEEEDDGNDGDISSAGMTIIHDADVHEAGKMKDCSALTDGEFKRERPKYKSLTKIRMYTYEGQPMTSQVSKVVRQGQEDRLKMDRYNKKMDMRALQLLQMTENKHYQNLLHHFKRQTRDLQRNFSASVKRCLKSYTKDLERLARSHRQSVIKLQLQQDQEFNEVIKRVKIQQEKDYKSLQSMLKAELKFLIDDVCAQNMDRKFAKASIEGKEMENLEVMRIYKMQQKEQMKRMVDELRFKHLIQQTNMENNFLTQKHDLYRACEGSIWKLEEYHLSQKSQLVVEQHRQMYELQLEQIRARQSQEMEQLTKAQKLNHLEILKNQEEEERKLSKTLTHRRRQRIHLFKESLKIRVTRPHKDNSTFKQTNDGELFGEDDSKEGSSGYMSLEREHIKKFKQKERYRTDEIFRDFRLKHKNELQDFQLKCREEIQEMQRSFQERKNHLNLSLDLKLKEEEKKDRQEHASWQQSLVTRKRALEEELERQKSEQERFFRNVLRSSSSIQDSKKRYFEIYDRNFEHREGKAFVLDANNYQRPESRAPDTNDNMFDSGFHAYSKEVEDQHFQRGLIASSQMWKSTPNFIRYWSGFKEDNSSSTDDDNNHEIDSGYNYRTKGQGDSRVKKCVVEIRRFSNQSDDEISTIL